MARLILCPLKDKSVGSEDATRLQAIPFLNDHMLDVLICSPHSKAWMCSLPTLKMHLVLAFEIRICISVQVQMVFKIYLTGQNPRCLVPKLSAFLGAKSLAPGLR